MSTLNQNKISMVMAAVFGILFLLVVFKSAGLSAEAKNLRAENSKLIAQIDQLSIDVKAKEEKIEFERNLYTGLAARLHKETKRVAELEAQFKK